MLEGLGARVPDLAGPSLSSATSVAAVGLAAVAALYAYDVVAVSAGDPFLPGECVGAVVDSRCRGTLQYPLGTNVYGEDLGVLVVAGMRVAVTLSLVTATILVTVATVVGTPAGLWWPQTAELIFSRYSLGHMPKISVEVPAELLGDLDDHVGEDGKFVNRSEAIRASVRKTLDILDDIDDRQGRLGEGDDGE